MSKSVPFIQCSNLTYTIGFKKIIKNTGFEIFQNEIVGLAGDNGSGKSTLLKLLLKKNRSIVWNIPENKKFPVSFLGHEPGLYSSLTLQENLQYFAGISGGKFHFARMEDLLHRFRLKNRMLDPVSEFSRGMLQKAAIIRTLCMSSWLYLLDEPYTGLDESSCLVLNEIIQDLKKEASVILVVHDTELSKRISDRIIYLKDGQII